MDSEDNKLFDISMYIYIGDMYNIIIGEVNIRECGVDKYIRDIGYDDKLCVYSWVYISYNISECIWWKFLYFLVRPYTIADFVSILPYFVNVAFEYTPIEGLRVLRSVRLLRMLRLFKLSRYMSGLTYLATGII